MPGVFFFGKGAGGRDKIAWNVIGYLHYRCKEKSVFPALMSPGMHGLYASEVKVDAAKGFKGN